jgi:hypothetical protein
LKYIKKSLKKHTKYILSTADKDVGCKGIAVPNDNTDLLSTWRPSTCCTQQLHQTQNQKPNRKERRRQRKKP